MTVTLEHSIQAEALVKMALPIHVLLVAAYISMREAEREVEEQTGAYPTNPDSALLGQHFPDVADAGELVLGGYVS